METDPDRRESADSARLIDSVIGYLRNILNTRQGNAQIAPDFGVPDFTAMVGASGLDAIRSIQKSMTDVIMKYEPRLDSVHLEFTPEDDSPLSMQFRMNAMLKLDGEDIPVIFETVLEPDGRINVVDR